MNNSYSGSDLSNFGGLGATFWACYAIFLILALVFAVVIYWKLFSKAGYSGWLSLLMFIPLVNFGMLIFLAFSDWPVLKELRDLRARVGGYGPPSGGYVPPAGGDAPPAPTYAPPQQQYAPAPPVYAPPAPPTYAPPAPPAEQQPGIYAPAVPAEPAAPAAPPADQQIPPNPSQQ
jgi:hypothetical protein